MPSHCIVIGVNEPPFEQFEELIRNYGPDSEAYRDLRFSFVDVEGQKLTYVDLLNEVCRPAAAGVAPATFKSCAIPNLAAVYLTHFLRKRGVEADFVNLFQHDQDQLKRLLDDDPACVAITTTFYVINGPVREIVEFVRRYNPRVAVVVGGPLIANHSRRCSHDGAAPVLGAHGQTRTIPSELATALRDIGADIYVDESQGELTLLRVVEQLKAGQSLVDVPNLVYAEGNGFVRTRAEPETNPLDECDIDWTSFGARDLGPTIQTRTARSCAFKCAFCNYPVRAGALSLSSIDTVQRELDSMRRLGGVSNVVFIDDTFNVPLPRFKQLCRMMTREQFGFDWFSYFRCSNADIEAFDLLAESGCKGVFLGIESGSPTILKHMNKAATVETYAKGIAELKRRGVLTFASFIVGFPGETTATVDETIAFVQETRPDYYRVQPWYCERGTPIDGHRDTWKIEGEGFVWRHATMDSLEAADQVERVFLSITESQWLPQWSFDFWIIPYLRGEGIRGDSFGTFMRLANRLLALDLASLDAGERTRRKSAVVRELRAWGQQWRGEMAGATA